MPRRPEALTTASRVLNVLAFGRWPEMLCSRAWRNNWTVVTTPCDAVFEAFFDEEDHCRACWERDFAAGVSPWPHRRMSRRGAVAGGEYESGQWCAFNRLLNHLNTLDESRVCKKALYREIMSWRPEPRRLLDDE